MKKHYFKWLLYAGAFSVFSTTQAQKADLPQASLQKISADRRVEKAQLSDERATPAFIQFNRNNPVPRYQAEYQLTEYLGTRQGLDELRNSKLTHATTSIDVQEWKQYFRGIPVEHGTYRALMQGSNALLMAGAYFNIPTSFNTRPALTREQALQYAMQRVGARKYAWQEVESLIAQATSQSVKQQLQAQKKDFEPGGELLIVKDFTKTGVAEMHLAYKFNIYASEPLSRDWIYVDAQNGKILFRNPIIHHASVPTTVTTRYAGNRQIYVKQISGNDPNLGILLTSSHPTTEAYVTGAPTYVLIDDTRGGGMETYDLNGVGGLPISVPGLYAQGKSFTDVDNNWTVAEHRRGGTGQGPAEAENDDIAWDAHWGAEMVYDYWKAKHNRLSYDGNNAAIKSFIHYGPAYDNAFWNGTAMTYGDGSGTDLGTVCVVIHPTWLINLSRVL
jgi:Zn-dependent metalloprotease